MTGSAEGKIATGTGAASPIVLGHAMAQALVQAGAKVALCDVNEAWLDESVREMEAIGGAGCALGIPLDVTEPDSVDGAVSRTIEAFGTVHILVNNAGINQRSEGFVNQERSPFWELTPAQWERVVDVNLNGPFFMTRAAIQPMLDQKWGRIISVTTSMDTMWRKYGSPYGPSKAGHEALVATMAGELEDTGVTANVLVPGGATYTNMTTHGHDFDTEKMIPASVMQAPVVWLASDASSDFNGQRIIGYFWDEELPIAERLEKASAPAAWPQLGRQAIVPGAPPS